MKKVVFCVPAYPRPCKELLLSLRLSVPLVEAAGWEHGMVSEIGCPYISAARATMLRKALDAKADAIVFIDQDMSWERRALVKLIETEGDVVAGFYRFKYDDKDEYMGTIHTDAAGHPRVRSSDGAIQGDRAPAGFMKITREAVNKFMTAYPDLCYGKRYNLSVDLFNHGAYKHEWWGEDYAFCRNWQACGGLIWVVPDLNINHHSADKVYEGNFHQFLMRQPGGSNDPARAA